MVNDCHGLAAAKLFAIPELLETILLLLQPKELLTIQRVSKTFQTTICSLPAIRRLLFLDPITETEAWVARPWTERPRGEAWQPESQSFMIGRYTVLQLPMHEALSTPVWTWHGQSHRVAIKVMLNPSIPGLSLGHWKAMTLADRLEKGEGLRMERSQRKILGLGREMFLTQPPCKEVHVWANWNQPKLVRDDVGVRLGQVLEFIDGVDAPAYMPYVFMLAKGVIALTAEDESMVAAVFAPPAVLTAQRARRPHGW